MISVYSIQRCSSYLYCTLLWHSVTHDFEENNRVSFTGTQSANNDIICCVICMQCKETKANSKAVWTAVLQRSQFNMNSSEKCSIHSVHHDANVLVGQPCTTLHINEVVPIIYTAHYVLIMCFSLHFSFHTFYFHFTAFPFPCRPRGGSGEFCPSPSGTEETCEQQCNSNVMCCCCCDHCGGGCPEGEGGPRWRGDNEELTGVLDWSMSLRSHIFRRRSRSFSSCSLVLRSLSSFLSLSSVASISYLQYTVTEQCQQLTKYLHIEYFPYVKAMITCFSFYQQIP